MTRYTKKKCKKYSNIRKTRKNKDLSKIKKYNNLASKYLDPILVKQLIKEFSSFSKSTNELPKTRFIKYSYSQEKKKKIIMAEFIYMITIKNQLLSILKNLVKITSFFILEISKFQIMNPISPIL